LRHVHALEVYLSIYVYSEDLRSRYDIIWHELTHDINSIKNLLMTVVLKNVAVLHVVKLILCAGCWSLVAVGC
jgi:hypothetical protein